MNYTSTRNSRLHLSAAEAIVQGISSEGGLFVPTYFPTVSLEKIDELKNLTYPHLAKEILGLYLTDFTETELSEITTAAYGEKFDTAAISPLVHLSTCSMLELWHGPTFAFKDMALQILPYLMTYSAKKVGEEREIFILVATSGDTGKAALEGFCDVSGTRCAVFYPEGGVSHAQMLQMITQEGSNTHVFAVKGNFDDAQTGVKRLFTDRAFADELTRMGKVLSSANSINWGRLVPQVAYYFSAYAQLLKDNSISLGEEVNFVVPTGNFGNILAAVYAKRMGLPIGKLICASNKNNVLADFINTGVYDTNRQFYLSTSPSMDILISSNLERMLFELSGNSSETICTLMASLKDSGKYQIDGVATQKLQEYFYGDWAGDDEVNVQIAETFQNEGYLMDTHTAVALCVYNKYVSKTKDAHKTVIVSTASPYKFGEAVAQAVIGENSMDAFACCDKLAELSKLPIPPSLATLKNMPILHNGVCSIEDMKKTLLKLF